MTSPKPTISRSIIIPYEVYVVLARQAEAEGKKVNALINEVLARYAAEVEGREEE